MNCFQAVPSVALREKVLALSNPIAHLAVHSETNNQREFPQRVSRDHPSSLKATGDHLKSATLPQEPQLNWGLEGPEFHFLDHKQNKVSGTKKIIVQAFISTSSASCSFAVLWILYV